jgi:hypothetical protein
VVEVMKLFRALTLLLGLLALPARVVAHQLDEYLQATLVDIEPGEIQLHINLTPGVAVAQSVLGLIDRDRNGVISTNETAAYAEMLKRDLVVRLDRRNVELKLAALNFPEPSELRTGWGVIQLEYSVTPGALARGPHQLSLENRHLPTVSVYLFNAGQPKSPAIQILGQKRNKIQSTGEITFDFHPTPKPFNTGGIVVSLASLFFVFGACVWQTRKKTKAGL